MTVSRSSVSSPDERIAAHLQPGDIVTIDGHEFEVDTVKVRGPETIFFTAFNAYGVEVEIELNMDVVI